MISTAASRVFVHVSIVESFVAGLKERFDNVAMGQDPSLESTVLGPIVDKIQFDRVKLYLESGEKESGAELVTGGACGAAGNGLYIKPTIFLNPKKDAKIFTEEIFGPVLSICTFETEAEAIELANDTSYGLSGTFFPLSFSVRHYC
jgi:aldehyde dehydrogenase (NAD+)